MVGRSAEGRCEGEEDREAREEGSIATKVSFPTFVAM